MGDVPMLKADRICTEKVEPPAPLSQQYAQLIANSQPQLASPDPYFIRESYKVNISNKDASLDVTMRGPVYSGTVQAIEDLKTHQRDIYDKRGERQQAQFFTRDEEGKPNKRVQVDFATTEANRQYIAAQHSVKLRASKDSVTAMEAKFEFRADGSLKAISCD